MFECSRCEGVDTDDITIFDHSRSFPRTHSIECIRGPFWLACSHGELLLALRCSVCTHSTLTAALAPLPWKTGRLLPLPLAESLLLEVRTYATPLQRATNPMHGGAPLTISSSATERGHRRRMAIPDSMGPSPATNCLIVDLVKHHSCRRHPLTD